MCDNRHRWLSDAACRLLGAAAAGQYAGHRVRLSAPVNAERRFLVYDLRAGDFVRDSGGAFVVLARGDSLDVIRPVVVLSNV